MMTVARGLDWAMRQLPASSTPRLDAEVLLAYTLRCSRTELHARATDRLSFAALTCYGWLIWQRRRGVPVAYLTGVKEFFGLEFLVNRQVLIPRPETETIVKHALALARQHQLTTIYEVGTGSGNIAVSLAYHLPDTKIIASDISQSALAVARHNAERHRVNQRIEFVQSDLATHIPAAELVVANLPYVPTNYQPVREIFYEPAMAVFVPEDGLELYRKFFNQIQFARAIIELGPWQVDRLTQWLSQNFPTYAVELIRDESDYICGLEIIAPAAAEPTRLPQLPASVVGHHS